MHPPHIRWHTAARERHEALHRASARRDRGDGDAAICALALRDQWLPPTLHHRTPDPACEIDIVPNTGRAHRFRLAMNNAFGFGGANCSLVLGLV